MLLLRKFMSSIKKRRQVNVILNTDVVRMNVGSGGTNYTGWVSVDKEVLDITNPDDFQFFFSEKQISKILAEHVIEHIYLNEFIEFLRNVKDFLTNDATIRLAVPDANHPSTYVRELTKPDGFEPGAEDHKVFYHIEMMRDIAKQLEYRLVPIEYFDEEGVFYSNIEGWKNGYISRCSVNYQGRFTSDVSEFRELLLTTPVQLRSQFIEKPISYTSLIVDLYVQ